MELFDYIEVFYNQRRRHSTLGYVEPRGVRIGWGMDDRLGPTPRRSRIGLPCGPPPEGNRWLS